MKISVCMGTYNGKQYIEEQLACILHQTRQPDEVVLCDDGSVDGTVDEIERFIKDHKLEEKWKLYQNKENRGYPENFYHAMELCSGDIVFLADQDDIWDVHKIERLCEVLKLHPQAQAVCCKFGLVDARGEDIHTLMQPAKCKGTKEVRSVSVRDVFYKCEWPGMVIAYRREWFCSHFKAFAGSAENVKIPHDFLVCAWAAEENGFLQLDEELAYHRRHEKNAGGEEHRLNRLLNKERKLKEIRDYNTILDAFAEGKALFTKEGTEALEQKRKAMQQRYDALLSGRVWKVLGNAWTNRKDTRLATVACDFLIVKKRG